MIHVGVGMSSHRDPRRAGREAAENALKEAGITSCDFVMMFATCGYPAQPLLEAVRSVTGDAPLSGCSGAGVIAQNVTNESNHAIVVMVWKSDELRFSNVKATGVKADSKAVGEDLARALGRLPEDAQALFLFADGVTFNFDRFQEGFERTVNASRKIPLIGGTAFDNWAMKETHHYHNGEVFSDGVSAALISGKGSIAFGANHGCIALGHERIVTKSDGNVIYEFDGKPAIEVLKEYLSEDEIKDINSRSHICLGWKAPSALSAHYDEYIVRYISQIDPENGSIRIQTNVAEGTKVSMTRRDADKMYHGVEKLGEQLKQELGGQKAKAVFHFDCASRGERMFSEQEKTRFITRLQEVFDQSVPWIGFYTTGEIAPIAGENYFHNFTVTIAAVY